MTCVSSGGWRCHVPTVDMHVDIQTPDYASPRDPVWRAYQTPWPLWVKDFRQHQLDAVEQIIDGYRRGKKVMVLDAPVGAGKTLIAEMVRRRLGTDMLYVAHSRGLQDQFLADFAEYARVLKGRSNYETELYTYPMYTASDCTAAGGACKFCTGVDACAYQVAKKEARGARVAVVNTAYMLSEAGGKGALCTKRAFTVVDECDTLEPILAGTVEFSVGSRDVEWLGIDPPKKGAHGRTVASWVRDEWMEREVARYKDLARETGGSELDQVKRRRRLKQMADRMAAGRRAADGIEGDGWVRDYQPGKGLVLKPVMVDWAGQERVWRHADKWLLMSGTVIDAQVMCDGLGLDRDEWELVTVPMTFPAENRITRVVPVVKMTKKELDADEKGVMDALESALWVILERHASGGRDPEDRQNVLLHTVSYRLSEMVEEIVREWCEAQVDMYGDEGRVPLHTYRAASDRDHALEQFKEQGGVLIGPSLDRGVDLPGDLCRVQVIVKVPFPNLGDKVIATRMRNAGGLNARGEQMTGGQRWYATETARVIVQMTGRGVRSATDWCVTYVLDKAFLEWYNRDGKALLPKWWRDAMKMELVRDYQ